MTNPRKYHRSKNYRIKLQGCLDPEWSLWFESMDISTEGGVTVLEGPVADQAALHGLLNCIRDLNLKLLSLERIILAQEEKH